MKAIVNTQVINAGVFDSGALGILAMVVHQFSSPGTYQASIQRKGRLLAAIPFEVDEKSTEMQLDIDLAESTIGKKATHEDCECKEGGHTKRTVSSRGYVLFHVSSGTGYSVIVSDVGGRTVFDSTRLGNGDLFAVSLLEPTSYFLSNTIDSTTGTILVNPLERSTGKLKSLESRFVDVAEKRFETGNITLESAQGLVFRIKSPARIVITKKSAAEPSAIKPTLRWQKLKLPH